MPRDFLQQVDFPMNVNAARRDDHGPAVGRRLGRETERVENPNDRPIPVIILPALRSPVLEDFQIMATPKELGERGQR